MKKSFIYMAMAVMLLFVTGCHDGDECDTEDGIPEEQPVNTVGIPKEAQTFVGVMKEESYTPDEFLTHLGSPSMTATMDRFPLPIDYSLNDIGASFAKVKLSAHLPRLDSLFAAEVGTESDGTRRWRFESYTFTYESVTSDGQRIEMSGRVTFPNNVVDGIDHEVATLSLHSHQEINLVDWAPSENLMFMPMRAMYNSAVIEPDFQNYGINNAKVLEGAGSPKALARQLADCAIAALEVMRQHGVTLAPDGHTTNWGSSKHVNVALAFANYYETEAPQWFRDAIRLGSTFAGEGNIDLSKAIPYYFQRQELYAFGLSFMGHLSGLTANQLGGYELKDLLSPWFTTTTINIDDKDYTILNAIALGFIKMYEANSRLPEITSLDQVLAPDLITPDGRFDESSPKAQAFLSGLSEESGVYGWEPTLPIYIAHCTDDQIIPYSCSWEYYLGLSNQGTNPAVHWVDVPYQSGFFKKESITSAHAIVSMLMHWFMSCVKEPADMMKLYNN